MDNSIQRDDTILNITPEVRKGHGSQKLVYLLLIFGGLGAIIFGAYLLYLQNHEWAPEILIASGVAIAAPGILSFLYRKYMLDEIKLEIQKPAMDFKVKAEEMIAEATETIVNTYRQEIDLLKSSKSAGLIGIFNTRQSGIQSFLSHIETEQREIIIVGSSLKGLLLDDNTEYIQARQLLLRKKNENPQLKIFFLFTHPIVADLRADQENRPRTVIGKEIIDSIEKLIDEWQISHDHIKLYVGTPTTFGIKTSQAMLLNPYPYMKEAFASPCFIVEKGGFIFTHFEQSHFNAWNSEMAKTLKKELSYYRDRLESYAKAIGDLYKMDTE